MTKLYFFVLAFFISFQVAAQTNDTVSIPFLEDWNSGSFETNGWETNSSNWIINENEGNDAPSAAFQNTIQLIDYSETLTSVFIDADTITEGNIWLDFDLILNDISAGGSEKLSIEINNSDDSTVTCYEIINIGSFDWTPVHLDISKYGFGNLFKIRFTTSGLNSSNIQNWIIDNIHIYRTCDPPSKLEGNPYYLNNEIGALLKWKSPILPIPPHDWTHWDDGTNYTSIGLDYTAPFTIAARWAANTFPEYEGTFITKIRVFVNDGFTGLNIKIWTEPNAENLIYFQDVTDQIIVDEWTEITLLNPITYDITKELWIGYTVDGVGGMYPAGADNGPAVTGFGDKISLDGINWDNLSTYGLDYNWNIQMYIEKLTKNSSENNNRALSNFNIFRLKSPENDYSLLASVPGNQNQENYEYFDPQNVIPYTMICYKVTAFWVSESDSCESIPAKAKLNPYDNYVCVDFTESIKENDNIGNIKFFPNPVTSQLNIESETEMQEISLINTFGQVVFTKHAQGNRIEINTSGLQAGVYLVRVKTEAGIVNRRVVVSN